jgi:four helix bundle protein
MTRALHSDVMPIQPKGPKASSFRDLDAWKVAMDLVTEIYAVSRSFPSDERFGLTSQLRRAAVSIPANIAEGNARQSRAEYRHFVSIARGSLAEVETELEIARRLTYVDDSQLGKIDEYTTRVGQMLTRLGQSLEG